MSGLNLYKGLIEATKKIVAKFGKEVLLEDRFVNILADMYPDRDNPALYGIIKTLVRDGYCSDLLACDKDSVTNFISKSTLALNKIYGYDKVLVENIIYSLAIGSRVIYKNDIDQHDPTTSTPPSKQNSNNQNPPQPATKQNKASTNHPKAGNNKSSNVSHADIGYLVLALLGLVISSVFYYFFIKGDWWLFGALLASSAVYIVTIVPSAIHFENHGSDNIYGSFSAVGIMACIVTVSPLLMTSFHSINLYYGSYNNDYTFISILFALLICLIIISMLSLRQQHNNTNAFNKGFYISIVLLLLVYQFIIFMPFYHETYMNIKNSIVRDSRNKESITLSFQSIKIGDVTSEHTNWKRESEQKYSLTSNKEFRNLTVKGCYYINFVDSVLFVESRWNNSPVEIYLYSYQDTIHAIKIRMNKYKNPPVSLVSIYKTKYGEPEIENSVSLSKSPDDYDYYWNFKNGFIRINSDHEELSRYHNEYYSVILYMDNKFEELYNKKIVEEQEIKIKEEERERVEKKKKDSIEHIKKLEQEKRKEIIKKKAIEQI